MNGQLTLQASKQNYVKSHKCLYLLLFIIKRKFVKVGRYRVRSGCRAEAEMSAMFAGDT